MRKRGGWAKYQKQQSQLQQRQHQLPGSAAAAAGSGSSGGRHAAAAAGQEDADEDDSVGGFSGGADASLPLNPGQRLGGRVNPAQLPPRAGGLAEGPRRMQGLPPLRSARDVAEDGRGLARAIGKTLGVLRHREDEREAVEAEEQVLLEGGGGELEGGWGRDYYYGDEADDDEDDADLEGAAGYAGLL